jgi:hypothetical protein
MPVSSRKASGPARRLRSPDATGPTAKSAFGVLERAQLVSRVGAVSRCGLPPAVGAAEVDYVMRSGASVRPVEVKSGPAGRLRSLHQLLLEMPECAPGVVLSEAPYAELPEQGIVFCPLYFAGSLGRSAFAASA